MSMTVLYRVRQVLFYTWAHRRGQPAIDPDAKQRLSAAMELQFRILSNGDQVHLLRVYRYLRNCDADEDSITAGLIHDVGKACRKCNISILDRCLHVFCNRFLPGPYRRFAQVESTPRLWIGLHRLANHARRGASAAQRAGYNERVQWLIRCHENGGNPTDSQLQLLRRADHNAGPEYDR